jgi:ankyrin repeat protein
MDTMSTKPIHFAAVNESPEALKLLIEKGANIFDQDMMKKTALHFAAIMGRTENIKYLLENQPRLAKVRDR